MPTSRSVIRNVHLFDPSRPIEPLGGLYLNSSVTRKKFLRMLEIVIRANSPYSVFLRGTEVPLTTTDVRCIVSALSRSVRTERDGKCVITGVANPVAFIDDWASFEAAHIFRLSHEEQFRSLNYPRFVTHRSDETDTGINSCQNGLLMRSSIHHLFGTFKFSIDPDDDYKITCFSIDMDGNDGRTLDPLTVLANMKGEGEPVFEFDFPDGSDMVGEILSGPRPGERMEAELFFLLYLIIDLAILMVMALALPVCK
ncbi:HNH endonuclease-domain-containing protein [Lipomyces starkeyi]